jgi:pseudaminic acid biosynthesis-associated methylase
VKEFKTDQEKFWAGDFGNKYASRNCGEDFVAGRLMFFSRVLSKVQKIDSVIEYGSNIGENLRALSQILPKAKFNAVEINQSAAKEITKWSKGKVKVFNQSIIDFKAPKKYDLVFTKGVLIHINPNELKKVYASMYKASAKYILVCEYYNVEPVAIDYRGHQDRLFKRDFCGEIMKQYPSLELVDYGFIYHGDEKLADDDQNWFLLQKK